MDAKMIFNLEDANCDLPTTGKAWEILLEHVKENAMHRDLYLGDLDDDDIIQEVRERNIPYENIYGEDATVGELFNDDDIIDHIHESGIPADAIWDEDELRDMEIIQTMLEQEREELDSDGWKKADEYQEQVEELEEKVAKLEEKVAKLEKENAQITQSWGDKETLLCVAEEQIEELEEKVAKLKKKNAELMKVVGDVERVVELERQLAEFREWNAKMKDNENEEWCRRCGSWQNCERDGSDIIKDAKWGYVCHDCLHHLDNPDHERCKECDCCKDCDCCECDEPRCGYCLRNKEECEENKKGEKNELIGWLVGEGWCCDDCHHKEFVEGQIVDDEE